MNVPILLSMCVVLYISRLDVVVWVVVVFAMHILNIHIFVQRCMHMQLHTRAQWASDIAPRSAKVSRKPTKKKEGSTQRINRFAPKFAQQHNPQTPHDT